MRPNALTLYELNALVRETLEVEMPRDYWVEAELSEVREVRGHCYMQLIQKDAGSNTPVAQASARCWRSQWALVRPYFERVTQQRLHAGMKVLLLVHAQFHENYGFSWIVTDIDPTYTLGDMARKRQEIIQQLRLEGVFDAQKELSLPLFCQHIAVVSSENAAGYGDFVNQLENNAAGFHFTTRLFPAIMQGEQVERSVIAALNAIYAADEEFDCVVIIRGGGATADLSGFDTLMLAENVANFPLPIITGIGHERDESVLDMISFQRVKTPTAAAAFLVEHLKAVAERIDEAQNSIVEQVEKRMEQEKLRLTQICSDIPRLFSRVRLRHETRLNGLQTSLSVAVKQAVSEHRHQLKLVETRLRPALERALRNQQHRLSLLAARTEAVNPDRLLRRGYSITLHEGRVVRSAANLHEGDKLVTRLAKGEVHSVVVKQKKH